MNKEQIKEKILKEDNFLEDAIIERTKMMERRKRTMDEQIHKDTLELLISIKELHIKFINQAIEETSKAVTEELCECGHSEWEHNEKNKPTRCMYGNGFSCKCLGFKPIQSPTEQTETYDNPQNWSGKRDTLQRNNSAPVGTLSSRIIEAQDPLPESKVLFVTDVRKDINKLKNSWKEIMKTWHIELPTIDLLCSEFERKLKEIFGEKLL